MKYLSFYGGYSKIIVILLKTIPFVFRVQMPSSSTDKRRSDFFIPNGFYSDLILLIWCFVGLILLYFGIWKPIFLSLLVIVCFFKVAKIAGRKFGYNILRANEEMSFYPIRLI